MNETESNTLYNAVRNSDKIKLNLPSKDKHLICCCISDKWFFEHTGIASISIYDENTNNCCICLDCCTWCLEFHSQKYTICKNKTICYLCCCSIYFT